MARCETGSIFYPVNATRVRFKELKGAQWITLMEVPAATRPTALQPNTEFVVVATYRVNTSRWRNGMRITCELNFEGTSKVESKVENLTVYCMQII